MPHFFKVILSIEQRAELEPMRDHHPKPYVRERAAAILKVVDGPSVRPVALGGLLKRRKPETIQEWISRHLAHGPAGLRIQPGRGRKPAFSPSAPVGGRSRPRTPGDGATLAPAIRFPAEPVVVGWLAARGGLA